MPSSLATVLSLTSGSSPCPPVSVLVRAAMEYTRNFSWKLATYASVLALGRSLTFHALHPDDAFHYIPAAPLRPQSIQWVMLAFSVIPSLPIAGTGISACFPSTTPFGLALGPDLPRADEPSPGILGLSVCRILTYISLLTPAFSLLCAPPLLTIWLLRCIERSPTTCIPTNPQLR